MRVDLRCSRGRRRASRNQHSRLPNLMFRPRAKIISTTSSLMCPLSLSFITPPPICHHHLPATTSAARMLLLVCSLVVEKARSCPSAHQLGAAWPSSKGSLLHASRPFAEGPWLHLKVPSVLSVHLVLLPLAVPVHARRRPREEAPLRHAPAIGAERGAVALPSVLEAAAALLAQPRLLLLLLGQQTLAQPTSNRKRARVAARVPLER